MEKKWQLCDGREVWAKSMAVIILQYINISDQNAIHLKFIQCHVSVRSQECWGWGDSGAMHWKGLVLLLQYSWQKCILRICHGETRGTIYIATGSQKSQCPENQNKAKDLVPLDETWKTGAVLDKGEEEESTAHTGPLMGIQTVHSRAPLHQSQAFLL